jgi:proliferating cell nuclear antigen PCNA
MEIIPKDASLFRSAVEALKEFLPLAQLHISDDGLAISGMDVSHVGFVNYKLAAEDCETLQVPTPLTIGMDMIVLARTLSAIGAGEKVTLSVNKAKDKLVVSYANEKASKRAIYELRLMDIQDDSPDIPDMTYAAEITARTADISAVIKDVAHFSDNVQLRLDEEGFHVSASGDAGNVKQTLENTEDREMALAADNVEASFGIKYLMQIMKSGTPLSSTTHLEFDGAQPLRASFRFGSSSHFIAYLAPKIVE